MSNFNAIERLTRARIQIQQKNSFFAYLSLHLKFVEKGKEFFEGSNSLGCGVDIEGNLYYKKEFIDNLRDNEIEGLLIHEILHLAFIHLVRLEHRHAEKWNVACDVVVNYLTTKNGFSLPSGAITTDYDNSCNLRMFNQIIEDVNTKMSEDIYEEIKDNKEEQSGGGGGKGEGKEGSEDKGNGGRFDKHIISKKFGEELKKIQKEWKDKVDEAYTIGKMKGELPEGMERLVGHLHESKVDWKGMLNQIIIREIPYNYCYSKPSKKSISVGEYMPHLLKEKVDIAVCVDLSGSIGKEEYSDFISEIIGIARAYQERIDIHFYSHDTEAYDCGLVKNGNVDKIKAIKLRGGGGTSHVDAFNKLQEKNFKLVVFFTDGYSDLERINFDDYSFRKVFVIDKKGNEKCLKDKNCEVIKL